MKVVSGNKIRESLSEKTRVYLSGYLSGKQSLESVNIDGLEIGVSHYNSFTAEKAHYHKWNTEYNIIRKGSVKIYVFEEHKEYQLNEDDMYVIEPGKAYITKAQPETEVLFVKSPGGNDKTTPKVIGDIQSWSKDWNAAMDDSVYVENSKYDSIKEVICDSKEPIIMVIQKFFSFVREAFINAFRFFLYVFGIFAAGWGVFNYIISDPEKKQKVLVLFLIVIFSVVSVVFVFRLIGVIKGRMTVRLIGKHKVTIRRDDYQNNMDSILKGRQGVNLNRFAFVMGIDKTGKLDISSTGGVIYSVLLYLNSHYRCIDENGRIIRKGNGPQEYIQKVLNNYKGERETLEYGECVMVHMRLRSKITPHKNDIIPCNLLLIANSRKDKDADDNNSDDNMSDDNTSSIIVPSVFNHLLIKKIHLEGIMIGVMGTNGMKQPYKVVFSQIINQFTRFCYAEKDGYNSKRLFISFREVDYSRGNVTLSQLERYVRQSSRYYPAEVSDK